MSSKIERLSEFFEDYEHCELAIIAWEQGKHRLHPHLQCYFELDENQRVRRRLEEVLGDKSFHVEKAKGTRESNLNYCYAIYKSYELGDVRYTKGIDKPPARYRPDLLMALRNFQPRPFQRKILDIIKTKADTRTIWWFWDRKGNCGKSFLNLYLTWEYGSLTISGRGSDIKHALTSFQELTGQDPLILCVDLAREVRKIPSDLILVLEQIKNQTFFSGKYESSTLRMKDTCHIIVFANRPPRLDAFSSDRLRCFEIQPETWEAVPQSHQEIRELGWTEP